MARKVYSDLHGHLDPATAADDEICLILSDAERRGLIKLLGKHSPDSMRAAGLNDSESEAVDLLYHQLY
jgi:phosphoserine aminotransferase